VRAEDIRLTLNRSAMVVKPKQPFLDWLHGADSTSSDLTLRELVVELASYGLLLLSSCFISLSCIATTKTRRTTANSSR
jgi:hypothetical protein